MNSQEIIALTPADLFLEENLVSMPSLKVFDLTDFLALEIPRQELILSPWLREGGLCMIHAYRGIGKTHMSLGIAYAVSRGERFLQWDTSKPRNVLYIDGEMPARALQDRLNQIVSMYEDEHSSIGGTLRLITPDLQMEGMPDLAKAEGQAIINQYITDDIDLIILDNLSCLVRSGKEKEGDDWVPIQTWVLGLRAKGKSVLMIHHSGKSGTQRGCSKREDVLDAVITLERPNDYDARQGARFIVKYEKARNFYGDDAKPFEAQLCTNGEGKSHWKTISIEDGTYQKVINLSNDGLKQNEIAQELGIHKSNVSRHIKRATQEGLIKTL